MADETQINILNIQCKRRTKKKCFVVHIDFKLWRFREQYTYGFFLNMSHIVELCWFRKDPHRMCRFCARYSWVSVLGSLTILVAIA